MLPIHEKIIKLLSDNGIDWEKNKTLAKGILDLAMGDHTESLKQQVFSVSAMKEGRRCPVCNQTVKMMRKNIDSSMAYYLIKLYRITHDNPLQSWFHVSKDIKVSYEVGGRFAKLRFWGLIEEKPKDITDDKRTSGMWRISEKGKLFVEGGCTVKKYVKLYNMRFYGFDGDEQNIEQVIKNKFSYNELMAL